ncbi:hypothetical protein ACKWTF_008616 [Chironomus riparius]
MELYKLISLILLIHESMAQHRRFYGKRHNQNNRNHFGHSHRNHPQFQHFNRNQHQEPLHEPIILASSCPQIDFVRALDNRWYGSFNYNPIRDQKGIKIEIEFNDAVVGFVNDFSHSASRDNRIFVITDDSKMLKRREVLKFNFFVNFNELSALPVILKVKVNDIQLCPDEIVSNECADLEISNNENDSWEGILTIYGHQFNIGRKIDFLFDKDLLAFINDVGDSITNNQKIFSIINEKESRQNSNLVINFQVKFDDFEKVPKLQQIYVDNIQICLTKNDDINRSNLYSTVKTTRKPRSELRLENLPFHLFPNATKIAKEVFNENYECGLSINSLSFRVNGGEIAYDGQFPFHAAIFYNSLYRCAGSLITEKASITAGHCVVNSEKNPLPIKDFHLLFGSVDLDSLKGHERLRKVSKIIKHPSYHHDKVIKQDIALIIVDGSLQFSGYIRPICLNNYLSPIKDKISKDMTVLGFGSTVESLEPSRYLHYGKMTIISRDECTDNIFFALLPEDSTFCAKSIEKGLVCPGDSGGGIVETINNKYYLRGIASITVTGSDGKCSLKNPVSFTDISAFIGWIKENLNK